MKSKAAFALLVAVLARDASALELNRYFSDGMVLQRDKPLVIRGTADNGSKVTVAFAGQTKVARADDQGVWSATLDAVGANTSPQSLTVSAGWRKKVTIRNVLVGDVILHARQTSIDISLGRDEEGRRTVAMPCVRRCPSVFARGGVPRPPFWPP